VFRRRTVVVIRAASFTLFGVAVLLFHYGIASPLKVLIASQPLNLIVALRRTPDVFFLSAFGVILLTAFAGRLTCGLFCPVGIAQDAVGCIGRRKRSGGKPFFLRYLRFGLLVLFVLLIVTGINIAFVVEPYTLFARAGVTSTQSLLPQREGVLASFGAIPFWVSVLFLVGVVASALIVRRAFCRFVCPAGALLSLIALHARLRIVRDADACHDCALYEGVCDSGALRDGCSVSTSDCYLCFRCLRLCPDGALRYRVVKSRPAPSPITVAQRRRFIALIAGGALAALLLRPLFARARRKVRPPTAGDDFAAVCNRCLLCVSVCPNGLIKPSFEGDDFLLPFLDIGHMEDDKSYCEYECLECGRVCPVGAIRFGTLKEKWSRPVGLAVIDETKCITYSAGFECLGCEEVCSVPEKAVRVVEVRVKGEVLRAPKIDADMCVGCGSCAFNCPEKAIQVMPL